MPSIRVADPARDGARIAEIYRPYVEETLVSFEDVAPTASEIAERLRTTLEWTPWLVAEETGSVVGYAYASRHRERPGYRWSVDISVYIDPQWQRRGMGRALYTELLPILKRQGFVNVYAGIATPNPGSVRLHESIGMTLIGVYERVGFKFGEWPDVAWYGMRLREPASTPVEPTPFAALDD
ncbi:MAG: arsinothricin resistance N-acetyltransferase ArsN1 family B [Candidatus Limnocylindrales bacterium]